jgi:hypothetical protein
MPQEPKPASLISVNYPVSNLSQLLDHLPSLSNKHEDGQGPAAREEGDYDVQEQD